VTTALRTRRSLVGAVLTSTMCSGLLTGSASAAGARTPGHQPADLMASRKALLTEPSRVLSSAARDVMVWPVEGRLTSTYGPRYGRMHRGIDVAAPIGTPVRAVHDGKVAFAGWKGGYGNTVDIAHDGGQTTRSAHQSDVLVAKGERVERGQVIGHVGTTGSSTGPHLHFEVSIGDRVLDPLGVLPAGG
jgi:murein DD-endopeptidase MepM/ murein hydrolase activator NlpD